MQGVSAFLIMLMHFVMQIDGYPRFFNIFGSVAVAVFLFISGYGINESYKIHGIRGFWRKRFIRVIIPCWLVFLFQLPFQEHFEAINLLQNLTFINSNLWFVDYILRWYLVYWACQTICPKYTKLLLFAFALYNIFQQQFYSEQAFSFLCGYLASEHIDTINQLEKKKIARFTGIIVSYGLFFLILKEMPFIQQIKGTLPFNIILLNIKLPLAMCIITMPYLIPVIKKLSIFHKLGNISYELYIVHYNFMPFITSIVSILVYATYSILISIIFRKLNIQLSQKGRFLQGTASFLYISICYILMCKYSMRATSHFGYVCLIYCMTLSIVILFISSKYFKLNSQLATRLFWPTMVFFAISLLIAQYHFDPMENQVDRWSAIANPIQYLLHGQFPYMAKTHLGGNASPFPIWLIFHIPFYLLNNVGLSEIFTALLFAYSIKVLYGHQAAIKSIILLALCINLWYEVAVRSDLISNFLLLATFINYLQAYHINLKNNPWTLAICVGVWLSTRLSVAFPLFILMFPNYICLKWQKQILIPLLIISIFSLTFLPLIIWDAEELFGATNNPFSLQFRQGSPTATIILLLIALTMSVTWKNKYNQLLLYAGIILMLIPIISYGQSMYIHDNWTDIFQSVYDITYIDAAIPFFITILVQRNNLAHRLT